MPFWPAGSALYISTTTTLAVSGTAIAAADLRSMRTIRLDEGFHPPHAEIARPPADVQTIRETDGRSFDMAAFGLAVGTGSVALWPTVRRYFWRPPSTE